jgi:tellurite resistance-related uncharacterized protein
MNAPYRSSPVFDETTLPEALRREHRTKAGTWGVIHVLEGALRFTRPEPASEVVLEAGAHIVVEPQQTHFVTPVGAMRMRVDFYNAPPLLPQSNVEAP